MKKYQWLSFLWQDLFKKLIVKKQDRIEFLSSTSFFHAFSPLQIGLTSEFLHQRQFAKDEFIFEVGHPGAALYFIEAGKVSIEISGDSHSGNVALAELGPGAFFGEMALLDDSPRSASARALTDVTVLAMPRSELERMLAQSPVLGGMVYKALAQITSARLKSTIERMQSETRPMKVAVNG